MRRSAVLSYLLLAVLGLLAIVATRMLGGREKMSTATDAGLTSGGQTSVPATSPPPVAAILEQTGGTGREQETGRQTQVVRSEPPQQSATDALGATPETLALRKKYDGLSYEELDLKARELEHLLDELSFPVFDEYLMLGKYQAVGVGQQYTAESWDSSELTQLRMPGKNSDDQRVIKIVIPESDHPDLVAMHREDIWLQSELHKLGAKRPR